LAYSVFNDSGYEIHTIDPGSDLEGQPAPSQSSSSTISVPSRTEETAPVPQLPSIVDPGQTASPRKYRPTLGLEALGMPYFSAGGGAFGTSVQGGSSFLFGDLLGDRQLFTAIHVSSLLDESAFMATYLDRGSRLNWGVTFSQVPQVGQWRSPFLAGEP